jgi:L-cystine uptake protein TcyP (sodium:dicarboxylate symporter family)
MVQIGPVRYNEEEERALVRAFLLGLLLGIPLGVFLNYLYGFPTIHMQTPNDFLGWTSLFLRFLISFLALPCMLTTILFCSFWKKTRKLNLRVLSKALWSILVFLFFLPSYVALTYSALKVMLGEQTAMIGYTLFTLLVTPFVILFLALFIPESRPGAVLYRFLHRLRKRNKKKSK